MFVLVNWLTILIAISLVSGFAMESQWLYQPLFMLGGTSISVFVLFLALFILIFAYKLSRLLIDYVFPNLYGKYQLEKSLQSTMNSVFHYLIMVVAVFISLNTLGINLNSLTIFASIFGVGIGFGMQNIASNFISGIIILFERPIKVGDRVIVDNIIGDVVKIKMRATVIRTRDNEHIIIPNSFFLEEKVINRSFGDLKIRIILPVGVSYSSDVKLVEQLLIDAAKEVSLSSGNILDLPAPSVIFSDFGDSSLNFNLILWIDNPMGEFKTKSDLRYKILELFRENNVEIPFPQRDIHMR